MKNRERGSITIYVLCSCLLISVVLIGIFMRNQAKLLSQKRQQQIIEEQYNNDDKIDEIYEETINNLQIMEEEDEN